MNTIKVKIIEWQSSGQSLICKFASDETNSSNPDDYTAYAFQPKLMWPHATTSESILEEIARAGISICKNIKIEEDLAKDETNMAVYASLVGTERSYSANNLISSNSSDDSADPDSNTISVDNLES